MAELESLEAENARMLERRQVKDLREHGPSPSSEAEDADIPESTM